MGVTLKLAGQVGGREGLLLRCLFFALVPLLIKPSLSPGPLATTHPRGFGTGEVWLVGDVTFSSPVLRCPTTAPLSWWQFFSSHPVQISLAAT